MKYIYATATGNNEIEIDETWNNLLIDMDRQIYNIDQRETRRHLSLNAYNLDDALLPSDTDVQIEYETTEQIENTYSVITKLPQTQRELLCAVAAGISPVDYARKKGVSKAAISQQLKRARKNLRENLSRPVNFWCSRDLPVKALISAFKYREG
jgi:RNA polymerase sigma-70 factor (ECF subfamily)